MQFYKIVSEWVSIIFASFHLIETKINCSLPPTLNIITFSSSVRQCDYHRSAACCVQRDPTVLGSRLLLCLDPHVYFTVIESTRFPIGPLIINSASDWLNLQSNVHTVSRSQTAGATTQQQLSVKIGLLFCVLWSFQIVMMKIL